MGQWCQSNRGVIFYWQLTKILKKTVPNAYLISYQLDQPCHTSQKAFPDLIVLRHIQSFHRKWASW